MEREIIENQFIQNSEQEQLSPEQEQRKQKAFESIPPERLILTPEGKRQELELAAENLSSVSGREMIINMNSDGRESRIRPRDTVKEILAKLKSRRSRS